MSRPEREGLLILGTLSGVVSILEHIEITDDLRHSDVHTRALEQAESATAQGRASQTFIVPYIGRFAESERAWANPDTSDFTRSYPAEQSQAEPTQPVALNPGQGEQPLDKTEAEAQAPTPTETLQGNILQGQQDGQPETTGTVDTGGTLAASPDQVQVAQKAALEQTPPAETNPGTVSGTSTPGESAPAPDSSTAETNGKTEDGKATEPTEHPPAARQGARASVPAKTIKL